MDGRVGILAAMTKTGGRKKVPGSAGDAAKAGRLAKALRANLKRRKAQARAKADPAEKPVQTPKHDKK